jgi:hypothetical protein
MLKISGNDILRGGEKIGWLESNDVFSDDGRKLGYFDKEHVFNAAGRKLAYIKGNHLYAGSRVVPLDEMGENVAGGAVSTIGRCAVYVLLGV